MRTGTNSVYNSGVVTLEVLQLGGGLDAAGDGSVVVDLTHHLVPPFDLPVVSHLIESVVTHRMAVTEAPTGATLQQTFHFTTKNFICKCSN